MDENPYEAPQDVVQAELVEEEKPDLAHRIIVAIIVAILVMGIVSALTMPFLSYYVWSTRNY